MRVGQEHVAVALDEVDAIAALADRDSGDRRLHRPIELDAVGLVVVADDLEVADGRQALAAPDAGLDGRRIGRLVVGADQADGRPWPIHAQAGRAPIAVQSDRPEPGRGRSPAGRSGGKSPAGRQAVHRPDPRHAEAPWCRRSDHRPAPKSRTLLMVSFPHVQPKRSRRERRAGLADPASIASHGRQPERRASYFFKGNSKVLDLPASTFAVNVVLELYSFGISSTAGACIFGYALGGLCTRRFIRRRRPGG